VPRCEVAAVGTLGAEPAGGTLLVGYQRSQGSALGVVLAGRVVVTYTLTALRIGRVRREVSIYLGTDRED